MASRVKKLFRRNKEDEPGEQQPRSRAPTTTSSDPTMRTSLYESAIPAGLPQTGDYPIKGNDSSIVLQAGRKSSVRSLRSRRSSSRGSQHNDPYQVSTPAQYDGSREVPRGSLRPAYAPRDDSNNPYQDSAVATSGQDDRRKRWSRSPLPQDFAGLNLGDSHSPTTVTSTVTTTTRTPHQARLTNRAVPQDQLPSNSHDTFTPIVNSGNPPVQSSYAARGGTHTEDHGTRRNYGKHSSVPKVHQDDDFNHSKFPVEFTLDRQREHEGSLARQKSIPRKQVGTSAQAPYLSTEDSVLHNPKAGHGRQQNVSKVLPSLPVSANTNIGAPKSEPETQSTGILNRSRPVTRAQAGTLEAKDIINRAKSNTYDTEVIEKVAPAVVHENVTKDVHYIREEVITREIHTHDVFHRILPVVDVEVLPPRHFLPVEGGGLVEVSTSEVPGRGRNWVIAETASKIPSDQAATQEARRFTARKFSGQEGDAFKYTASEGQEVTEQTWVHPPELEQGARLTGQSWPMNFGNVNVEREGLDEVSSKTSRRKNPKKGPSVSANPAQNASGIVQ